MSPSDKELLGRAGLGDHLAWEQLVDRHSQMVWANARAVGADAALAADVSQVVWMRLFTKLDTIREPAKIKGWLAIVARNAARSELRKSNRFELRDLVPELADTSPQPLATAVLSEATARMHQELNRAGAPCKELFHLLYTADLSYKETAELLSRTVSWVSVNRVRCLKKLRERMQDA